MISGSALILLNDGKVERPVSRVVKGDIVFNPITGRSSAVSAVFHRTINSRTLSAADAMKQTPVRFDPGSIGGRFPVKSVWMSQNAVILIREKLESSSVSRITAVKASNLVGRPGIILDREISEIALTKIVLCEPGLIYVSGIIVEASALSVIEFNTSPIQAMSVLGNGGNRHISPLN